MDERIVPWKDGTLGALIAEGILPASRLVRVAQM